MSSTTITATAEIMGTVVSIAARAQAGSEPEPESAPSTATFESAAQAAFDTLRDADRIFSTYRPDSPISQIRDGRLPLDRLPEHPDGESIRTVLALSAQLKRESDGAFDIWSAGGGPPGSPDLPEPGFDPSGLVKGWAAERASHLLAAAGVPGHSLGAGGDIQVRGGRGVPGRERQSAQKPRSRRSPRPWRIGISDPHRPGRLLTVVELDDGAVATSGTAERGAHIWDPRRGAPATALASVTIVGPELTWADGYATAAHALGGSEIAQLGTVYAWLHDLAARTGYQALTVTRDTDVWWTEGFLEHAPELRALLKR